MRRAGLTKLQLRELRSLPWFGQVMPTPKRTWLPIEEAKVVVHAKKFTSVKQFNAWEERPDIIPAGPHNAYKDAGWISYPDFLGTRERRIRKPLPFPEARSYMHSLGLKSIKEWNRYKSRLPANISKDPAKFYKEEWAGMRDWLGIDTYKSPSEHVQTAERLAKERGFMPGGGWLSKHGYTAMYNCSRHHPELFAHIPKSPNRLDNKLFEEARDLARAQGFNSHKEYRRWAKNIAGMPSSPHSVYEDEGWISWGDFLGTGRTLSGDWLPISEAKAVVRAHGIRTLAQFKSWTGKQAHRIPSNPNISYKDAGWIDCYDFFGREYTSGPRPASAPTLLIHLQTAEKLAAEHGILPSKKWLHNNGHGGLYQYIKKHPEPFAHIPRAGKHIPEVPEEAGISI